MGPSGPHHQNYDAAAKYYMIRFNECQAVLPFPNRLDAQWQLPMEAHPILQKLYGRQYLWSHELIPLIEEKQQSRRSLSVLWRLLEGHRDHPWDLDFVLDSLLQLHWELHPPPHRLHLRLLQRGLVMEDPVLDVCLWEKYIWFFLRSEIYKRFLKYYRFELIYKFIHQ